MCDFCRTQLAYVEEHIVRDDGGPRMLTWALVLAALVLALVVVAWPARADEVRSTRVEGVFLDTGQSLARREREIQRAAWLAYHSREVTTSDGEWDCDDHMMFAWRYLAERGIASSPRFCTRNGNGHTYLLVQGRAIDNRSPFSMSEGEVGCDTP